MQMNCDCGRAPIGGRKREGWLKTCQNCASNGEAAPVVGQSLARALCLLPPRGRARNAAAAQDTEKRGGRRLQLSPHALMLLGRGFACQLGGGGAQIA